MNPQVPDENDIVYNTYGLDFESIFRYLYEKILGGSWSDFLNTLEAWWNIYSVIAILFSLVFFVGFVYAKIRYGQLREYETAMLRDAEAQWRARYEHTSSKNAKWESIQVRVSENNPESWRVAIIEADIMLDETLTNVGYVGQSIGEKLKTANPNSFTTVQDAWEAHKVRNQIAHTGSDFVLTQKVARDTITQFGRVFKEFGII